MFTVIGCDSQAYILYLNKTESIRWYAILQYGCQVICLGKEKTLSGNYSGMGFCQTTIPRELKSVKSVPRNLEILENSSWIQSMRYSFIADKEWYNFSV
uniref:Uncharacterized protein n=1 Tax=Nelumbo nucifera TaxID=4432 RepID=A0A822YH06_NELNU|nr:TPA_asm: hypothetical protein HUJ06_031743 [Nelumbo nucifera]